MGAAIVFGLVLFLAGLLINFALIKAAVRAALSEVTISARIVEPLPEKKTAV